MNDASRPATRAYPAIANKRKNRTLPPANSRRFHTNHDTIKVIVVTENRIAPEEVRIQPIFIVTV